MHLIVDLKGFTTTKIRGKCNATLYNSIYTLYIYYFLFLSDEGPMLETLDHTIRIGSTPTFLYFELYNSIMQP